VTCSITRCWSCLLAALGGAGKAATAHGVELLAHGRKSHRTVVADAAALVGCRAIVRGSAAYGMPLALRLQGPLQVEVLRNSPERAGAAT
jgi:hypothetical protein